VIASVHIADVGAWRGLPALFRTPSPSRVRGLRSASIGVCAPFSRSLARVLQPGRVGLVAMWDDQLALDMFEASSPLGSLLASGWRARLEPLRAFGAWPGLPNDLTRSRAVTDDNPVVVLTLGRLRLTQAPRFFRTSAKAEGAVVDAPGMTWGTALARPPFVATVSVWRSARESAAYAFEHADAGHPQAIAEDRRKPFHHREAFIRFRPIAVEGSLGGRNPFDGRIDVETAHA
jgi:hypothetical protein